MWHQSRRTSKRLREKRLLEKRLLEKRLREERLRRVAQDLGPALTLKRPIDSIDYKETRRNLTQSITCINKDNRCASGFIDPILQDCDTSNDLRHPFVVSNNVCYEENSLRQWVKSACEQQLARGEASFVLVDAYRHPLLIQTLKKLDQLPLLITLIPKHRDRYRAGQAIVSIQNYFGNNAQTDEEEKEYVKDQMIDTTILLVVERANETRCYSLDVPWGPIVSPDQSYREAAIIVFGGLDAGHVRSSIQVALGQWKFDGLKTAEYVLHIQPYGSWR